jgi:hypothetical protein
MRAKISESMLRIHWAFVCYLVLAAIGGSSLTGDVRLVVLILLGGLALKTWVGHLREQAARKDAVPNQDPESGS